MSSTVHATFLVAAPDQPGLVARLAGFFYTAGLNIIDAGNHTDVHVEGGPRFFMRMVVDVSGLSAPAASAALGGSSTRAALERAFGDLAQTLSATWSVRYGDQVQRVAILVTKDPACLYDLVLRQRSGELPCEIPLVLSNHPTLEPVAESFRIPFFCLPVTADTKREQEKRILELCRRHHVDLVVLARYMQVLTEEFLNEAPPVINIHHGFLPAFQGAKPYHQAHARGVKMIGATAHYATKDLDQGPIIEQDVARVTHAMGPDEMARTGRDVERVVLSRAVRAHLERRVIVEGRRTIVL
ncbi:MULTISPECIES: formyltetrahydrofolate deformylase [Polyangium]|uniref:Formyltetrahydrofolate deformylase n=2 Tax=Polyangium TaxID=55 RepID=A0A4U1J710_9BACT|nr:MULTISPECIES: formyltetrahydrofolate deformylase [Polyangium]MDI1429710.1 formyltetrahydrofolate deformylase [Polyangium sorediatum]TKD03134.1 formyltetrahydrofolate deformylase [Polyangium fumosum]